MQAIDSVRNQNYSNWEMFIIDPGSSDNSRKIALDYSIKDSRIKLVFENDDGPADGLNRGLQRITGDILGCLNSDDFYQDNVFREVVDAFDRYPSADCIYSHGMILKSGRMVFQSSDPFSIKRYFSNRALIMQQSTFFRVRSLSRLNVTFNKQNKSSWDGEFLVDLASEGGVFKKVLGNWGVFRIYADSITGSKRLKNLALQDNLRMLNKQKISKLRISISAKLVMKLRLYSLYRLLRNYWIANFVLKFPKN
jgi:glycosyltransferase involved in cell wall biosynthesis